MATQPDSNLIDPSLLPQVQQTGGQLGLMRLLAQGGQMPALDMPAPRSVGQGLAQGGISFAQNFMQARQTQSLRRMAEQQLTAQRDRQLAEATRINGLEGSLIKNHGMPPEEAAFYARNAAQLGQKLHDLQAAKDAMLAEQRKEALEQRKADLEAQEWQSGYDSAFSTLGGFEIQNTLEQMQLLPPEQIAANGQMINTLQKQLNGITALSQQAANNPTVASEIASRFMKGQAPLPSEAEAITGARLDNQGKIIGNKQADFNLELDKTYAPKERSLGYSQGVQTYNVGANNLTQQEVATKNALDNLRNLQNPSMSPYDKAVMGSLNSGDFGAILSKNMSDGANNTLKRLDNTSAQYQQLPGGGFQKTLPPQYIGPFPLSPEMTVPVPGNAYGVPRGITPQPYYGAPPPVAAPPAPGSIQSLKNSYVIPNMTKSASVPVTPQQQGEAARNNLVNSLSQGSYDAIKGAGSAWVNTGGAVQGFLGLPVNPLDIFGVGQSSLNRLK